MRKHIITLALLSALAPWSAAAEDLALKDNHPDRYVVVKGDTLWDISGKFLKQPWRWPEIWKLNKDEIKDPHWIYPGDVIVLDMLDGSPQLRLVKAEKLTEDGSVVKLSPRIRVGPGEGQAIPVISPADIGPFLSQPLVVNDDALADNPEIIGAEENHVTIGTGGRAYVKGLKKGDPTQWQLYRPGKPLVDPATGETLGNEAVYLGEASVDSIGDVSTIDITKANQEILAGDRLVRPSAVNLANYYPHSPQKPARGQIISIYGGVAEGARNTIVAINRGKSNGMDIGTVLAIFRHGELLNVQPNGKPYPMKNFTQTGCLKPGAKISFDKPYNPDEAYGPCPEKPREDNKLPIPDERVGLLMVFRVFDRVSYGLVLQSTRPIIVDDVVSNP
jgi:hypothetical protein